MGVKIYVYTKKDYENLVRCMEGLQDYLVKIDSSKIMR